MNATVSVAADPVSMVSGLKELGVEGTLAAGVCLTYYASCGSFGVVDKLIGGFESVPRLESLARLIRGSCESVVESCEGMPEVVVAGSEDPQVAEGTDTVVSDVVVRGRHYASNLRKRLRRSKEKKKVQVQEEVSAPAVGGGLEGELQRLRVENEGLKVKLSESKCEHVGAEAEARATLAVRRAAENKLAALKAEQQYELLSARDLHTVRRMQEAQVMRTTEVCKVQVERAFSKLKKTGNVKDQCNVPVDGTGSAETVVSGAAPGSRSDGSGISPDSSVSMQEIRQMQKDLLDAAEKEKKYEEALGFLEHAAPELYRQAMYRANCKKAYTLDSQGEPEIDTVGSIRDGKFYPEYLHEGYALNPRHRSARNEVPFPGEEGLW